MERNTAISGQAHNCPILCITKSILFVIIATFILYLPLGDPRRVQCSGSRWGEYSTVCCLCDAYELMVMMAYKTTDILEKIFHVLLEVLYDAKLKFYSVLEKLDKKDLCRYVCCSEEWEVEIHDANPQPSRPRPTCRCIKKKCCKAKR